LAFTWWGLSPIYFKWLLGIAPLEIIVHRIVWSALTLLLVFVLFRREALQRSWRALREHWGVLLVAAVLLSTNWLVYVYAVVSGQVLEASLGYFINPLVNVALGAMFLGERLSRPRQLAVALALLAVVTEIARFGHWPWLAFSLAGTFGIYGLLRKKAEVGGAEGLLAETMLILPLAAGYAGYLGARGELAFVTADLSTQGLLMLSGVVTTAPLVWFIGAAKRLDYATVGLLQYIGPTLMGLLGFWLWHEPLPAGRGMTFALVWLGLFLVAVEEWRKSRAIRPPASTHA
jgi:chloramphenicol-sensitive protein RarD